MVTRDRAWLAERLAPVHHILKRELTRGPGWREAVQAKLNSLDVRQYELAAWVGSVPSQVSYLLNDGPLKRSEYVERVSVALGIPLPGTARLELAIAELVAQQDTQTIDTIASIVERIAWGRQP